MLLFYISMIESEEDQLTFQYIYEHYPKQMYNLAKGILGNHEAAEDAVQEAFFGIARSIHRVPTISEGAIRGYVLTVTRNAALAVYKTEKKWGSYVDMELLELPSHSDTFWEVAQAQDHEKMMAMLDKLPIQYREVLMCRYVLELPPREISAALHRKTTTVQQQLARGKKLLAALYEQEVAGNA